MFQTTSGRQADYFVFQLYFLTNRMYYIFCFEPERHNYHQLFLEVETEFIPGKLKYLVLEKYTTI